MRTTRARHLSIAFVASAALALGFTGCKSEEEDKGLGEPSAGSAGRGGSSAIPTAGTAGNAGNSSASGGGAGVGENPPSPMECETLGGLEQCGGTKLEAKLDTINVLIVLDKSGSMTDEPAGFDDDKWESMKEALGRVFETVNERVHLGLALYPYSPLRPIPLDGCELDCCAVPEGAGAVVVGVGPVSETGPAITDKLAETSPGGGTPTAAALASAYEYFTNGAGASLEGSKFVLLATDGGPNCNADLECGNDECTPYLDGECSAADECCEDAGEYCIDGAGVTERIEALAGAGIATFVVGIPGTDDYASYLDDFAVAGGVPNREGPTDYFAVSADAGVEGLVSVFTDITTELVTSCEVELTEEPRELESVNVAVDCEVVPQDGDDGSGWEYDRTPDPRSVILHGPICDHLQETGANRIDIVYGCPTVR